MTAYSDQFTLGSSAAQQIVGAGGQGPRTAVIRNDDASIVIYVGGSGVTTGNGLQIPTASTVVVPLPAKDDILYAIATSGSPVCSVLVTGS